MIAPPRPECHIDRDCPSKRACIDDHCENPCLTSNPCHDNRICSVSDSDYGKRVVACSCPEGHVNGGNNCKPGTICI